MNAKIIKIIIIIKNNLEIFEIVSDAKIKSIIEYEKEKKNKIKLLKHDLYVNNNNKYKNIDEKEEESIILKKYCCKDMFSFRPTNNDSGEISELEPNYNNFFAESSKDPKKNKNN